MSRLLQSRRHPAPRQRVFPFLERSRRLQRRFKRVSLLATLAVVVAILAIHPKGRYLTVETFHGAVRVVRAGLGISPDRREVDERWRRYREEKVQDAARRFREIFPEIEPPIRKLMVYAGSDPEKGLLRWGNFSMTLLLPSTVFLPDDSGRSYRLRPRTRSVWLRNISSKGLPLTFFVVPDTPALGEAMAGTGGVIVPGSTHTTNSWGLRGPEPDTSAPLRGIVLGDSYIQGMFTADDTTPTECLKRRLSRRLGVGVEVLNTGHLGYSPEQEYYTLLEYMDRIKPQFVVLSLFANDFGEIDDVLVGKGDWEEGKYWISRIAEACRASGALLLTVAVPMERQITMRRASAYYAGMLTNIIGRPGTEYCDPTEDFANMHIKLTNQGERAGNRPMTSPLFNGHIGDGHFSAVGCDVWAEAVCRRLEMFLKRARDEKKVTF